MQQPLFVSQVKLDSGKVLIDKFPVKSNFTLSMAETFGEWLVNKRRAAGLSQTELAERSRVTKATISLYEKDKIAAASKVEMQIGSFEGYMGEKDQKKLKAILDYR